MTGAGGLGQTLGNMIALKDLRSFKFKGMLRSGVSHRVPSRMLAQFLNINKYACAAQNTPADAGALAHHSMAG